MGVVRFGLVSLVRGLGFFIVRSRCLVCSLQSRVEVHTAVSAQFGALPPLRPSRVGCFLFVVVRLPPGCPLVRSTEKCAGFAVHDRPTQHGQVCG